MGNSPTKKGLSHNKHARVVGRIHGQTSGPRILHQTHDETGQEIWILQREKKHLPGVAREESRRRRSREIRPARLEETDVRDSGRIERRNVETVRRERRDEVRKQRYLNDFVVFKFDFIDDVVQEVCLRGIKVDWKTQWVVVKEQQKSLLL